MASGAYNRALVGRVAAILTTGEVKSTSFDLNEAFNSEVSVQLDFTLGSLTNAVIKFYVSMDGTNWYAVRSAGTAVTETHTADAAAAYKFALGGWKYFCCSLTGSGTVTYSTATITYRYLQRGSQR